MHQPLHLCGRAKGGNDIKVHWHNHVMKFHAVWDNALIAKAIGSTPDNYSHPIAVPALESVLLGKDYDPYIRRIVWEGLGSGRHAGQWGSEKDKWMSCPRPLSDSAVNAEWSLQEVLAAPRKPKPPARGGPPKSSDSDVLCPYAWGKPIHKLNCDLIWTPDLHESETETEGRAPRKDYPELDTDEYAGNIEKKLIVEKLLAQAGVRLAGILNRIFAK